MNCVQPPDDMEILMAGLVYEHLGYRDTSARKRYFDGSGKIAITTAPQPVITSPQRDEVSEHLVDPVEVGRGVTAHQPDRLPTNAEEFVRGQAAQLAVRLQQVNPIQAIFSD